MKLGAVLGERFEVQSLAGRGGMGAVYRALDRGTGGTVALKVLLELEPSAAARFQREAELLSSLHHPAIVRHLAEGLSPEGEPYLVMEWLEGEDLAKRLSRARPSVLECVELGLCVVDALGAPRSAGPPRGAGAAHRGPRREGELPASRASQSAAALSAKARAARAEAR